MAARAHVFTGGTVVTGDRARPRAVSLTVKRGRVVALDAAPAAGDGVVDLAGGTLVPGFRDGHMHPLWGGTETLDAPVADATGLDDLLDRVRRHAEAHPEASWVVGHGYPCEVLPRGVGLAAWLDRAVPDRPAALWASDHHTLWANSRALAAAGIDAATRDPPAGEIVRDAGGQPVGTLLESAMDLVVRHVPARGRHDRVTGLRIALGRMAAAGIVWAQEAALDPSDVGVYLEVAGDGGLTADVNVALRVEPAVWREQREPFRQARRAAEEAMAAAATGAGGRATGETTHGTTGGRVTVRTVKIFADGVIESGSGALLEPYTDDPSSRGILNWTPHELAEAAAAFDADGFQLHIHAIGDAGIRLALDAVEAVAKRCGPRDRRPVVAHTQLVHPEDLPRFAALGTIANFEPLWACRSPVMTELTEPRLGEARSAWQYPIASMLRSGAAVSFGSDWPVSPMAPMEGIATAVTRRTPEGDPPGGWLPHERISLDDALGAYTRGTAYQAFEESAGVLAEGARADLCLLDTDLDACAPLELSGAGVAATWLHGKEVYRR